jgi:hypothetical protein
MHVPRIQNVQLLLTPLAASGFFSNGMISANLYASPLGTSSVGTYSKANGSQLFSMVDGSMAVTGPRSIGKSYAQNSSVLLDGERPIFQDVMIVHLGLNLEPWMHRLISGRDKTASYRRSYGGPDAVRAFARSRYST